MIGLRKVTPLPDERKFPLPYVERDKLRPDGLQPEGVRGVRVKSPHLGLLPGGKRKK